MNIKFDDTDAEGFKELVEAVVDNLIKTFNPDEISVVRIKNWFDHKWLNYSGKRITKYNTDTYPSIPFVLEPYWNEEITIPPFNPNRVLSELRYSKQGITNSGFEEALHKFQMSTENKNNLISRRTNNGLCIWVSSNSEMNRQGSLMVYQIKNSEIQTWYASIEEKGDWKVTKAKGIDKNQIELISSESK
ncbi:hypothetical protein POV27_02835 [Aureisphaera galaxeae]|uniref:hypothetical protein n=1 Tax=Aureisphaera galaxeae TaxID=1538023 RepID=UPI00234FF787|nr:hypothetical protein [Aureisphaera galaxeae]MDC8002968.1 hypothetical protein [Aureisphaera galaxeae]